MYYYTEQYYNMNFKSISFILLDDEDHRLWSRLNYK